MLMVFVWLSSELVEILSRFPSHPKLKAESITPMISITFSAPPKLKLETHEVVFKDMEELRVPVDKLEMIVDKEEWPMPSYGDLLFEV